MEAENCMEVTQISTSVGSKAGRIWLLAVACSSCYVCAVHLDNICML